MGSRMMHLIIADEVGRAIGVPDHSGFLIGGVAPDATQPKERSHYFMKDGNGVSTHIGYTLFEQKYRDSIKLGNNYLLGYLCHLIADDLWLKSFYLPWLKDRMAQDPLFYELYHKDFRNLNGKLVKRRRKENLKLLLRGRSKVMDLEEVSSDEVLRFLPSLLGDFEYTDSQVNAELKVFTEEQIEDYVEMSIKKSITVLERLKNGSNVKGAGGDSQFYREDGKPWNVN